MNATLINGGKVHQLTGLLARCGVGKSRKPSQWQTDLGEATCQRCRKVARREGKPEKQVLATDGH